MSAISQQFPVNLEDCIAAGELFNGGQVTETELCRVFDDAIRYVRQMASVDPLFSPDYIQIRTRLDRLLKVAYYRKSADKKTYGEGNTPSSPMSVSHPIFPVVNMYLAFVAGQRIDVPVFFQPLPEIQPRLSSGATTTTEPIEETLQKYAELHRLGKLPAFYSGPSETQPSKQSWPNLTAENLSRLPGFTKKSESSMESWISGRRLKKRSSIATMPTQVKREGESGVNTAHSTGTRTSERVHPRGMAEHEDERLVWDYSDDDDGEDNVSGIPVGMDTSAPW